MPLLALPLCLFAEASHAQWFLEDAHLVDVSVGSNSQDVDSLARGRGLLSDGSEYSFERWYSSNWEDLRITMLTPLSRNFGVYWGFGTGESGEKYQIDPSIKVGFVATDEVSENGLLSLSVSVVLGGYMREEACTADYGAIGGIQAVNCRLADSPMPPSETLDYLLNEPPGDQISVSLRYRLRF